MGRPRIGPCALQVCARNRPRLAPSLRGRRRRPPIATPIDDGGIFGAGGVWAVAGDKLYVSSDRGATWVQRTVVSRVALDITSGDVLSSVFVLDANHGWTASPGRPGAHRRERGSTGVAVVDALHYVVIDSHTGRLLATIDGGVTWQQSTSSGLGAAMRLRFWDAVNGAAIAQLTNGPAPAAGMFRTTDGGQTWSPVTIAPLPIAGGATLPFGGVRGAP